MSEPTDVNQSHPDAAEGDAGHHRSRRAMRKAERAAEREAILTGQQPLLTRRELKRLREEAAALRAAVAAGEITPEEAKALQDPLAEPPEIEVANLEAAGSHAAPVESRSAHSGDTGEYGDSTDSADSAPRGAESDPRASFPPISASSPLAPVSPLSPVEDRSFSAASPDDGAPSLSEREAARVLEMPGPAGTETRETPTTPEPRFGIPAPGTTPSGGTPLADELERRSSLPSPSDGVPTGYVDHTDYGIPADRADDAPSSYAGVRGPEHDEPLVGYGTTDSSDFSVSPEEAAPGTSDYGFPPVGESASPTEPAASPYGSGYGSVYGQEPVVEDGPARDLLAQDAPVTAVPGLPVGGSPEPGVLDDPAPQVANTTLSDDDIEDISAQPTGVMDAVDPEALDAYVPPAPPAPAPAPAAGLPEGPAVPERRSVLRRDNVEPAGATWPATDSPRPAAESPSWPGASSGAPAADPAPAAGNRGEDVVEAPGGNGLPDWAADALPGAPARRPIVRIPDAAQGVRTVDADTGELSEVRPVGEDLEAIENPQWRVVAPEGQAPQTQVQAPAPRVSTGTPDAPGSDASLPPAPVPGPMVQQQAPAPAVRAPLPQAPADPGPEWGAGAAAAVRMEPEPEPVKSSRTGRMLLIGFIVLVVLLVVVAVVWFMLNRNGSNSALAALDSVPTWTALLV